MSGETRVCPVSSSHDLREGDRVYAAWYGPKKWWVIYHVRAKYVAEFEAAIERGDGEPIDYSYCAAADLPKPDYARVIARAAAEGTQE